MTDNISDDNLTHRFYFLCLTGKRADYEHIIKISPYEFVFFDNPMELIRVSLGMPPLAILIDIPTSIKLGPRNLETLENMYVVWPIIRCTINQSGFAIATSQQPPRRENLLHAIKAIANGDTSWNNKQYSRNHLRLKIPCRMRIRKLGNKIWCRGNCLNISSGGFFAVTYEPPGLNTVVEIQLLDLEEAPILLKAYSVWTRTWDETKELPGSGISIPEKWRTRQFRESLSKIEYIGEYFDSYD